MNNFRVLFIPGLIAAMSGKAPRRQSCWIWAGGVYGPVSR